ncbi:ABC transporter permease [Ornithinimicrobium pratense]|uniref:ABC transporter permease n=1 Tax=Ornithinimicrobium pratense TaxID=2593973 RepID=A0A5J6V266_9MICO|nr:ABC transporter permease [Ornithinimicrobium pratense]QFG67384.1 ABC transporter permease [Ornithinimicrobium pratense]
MRVVLALAALELRRFLSDRFNLFFVLALPLILVAVLGLQSGQGPVGRVALGGEGPVAEDIGAQLGAVGMEVDRHPGRQGTVRSVGDGAADLGVVVGLEDPWQVELVSVGEPHPGVELMVRAAVDEVAVGAARVEALTRAGVDPDEAEQVAAGPPEREPVRVRVESDNALTEEFADVGRFEVGASAQMLLFVFLNTLGASSAMIQARRSGAVRRGLAAPVTAGQTVIGLALGRLVIALFQAGWIIGMSSLLFGVGWGSMSSVLVVVALFGLIAAGLAMVVGVVMDAEGPASGVTVGAGMILAAVGGCMVPLELFTDGLRRVAMFTPHAWAYEALAEIQRRDAGVLDVLPQLAVLAGMATVVLVAGSVLLRRSLVRAM